MSTTYEVPLTANPQTFVIALAGTNYKLRLGWNDVSQIWVLDIFDETGQTPIACGLPLVTGVDLLGQLGYLNFGGSLTCQTVADLSAPPTYDNLGTEGLMLFTTP